MTNLKTRMLGRADYRPVWDEQKRLFQALIDYKRSFSDNSSAMPEESLLLVEHNPVITLGKHGKIENLLVSEETLKNRGIECIRIERGGDITYHGPGQLVAYPIIDLERYHLGVKDYVNLLEETVIRTIAGYGIKGERVEGASGVWIGKDTPDERKICALGVKCSHFVTMHGLALNVNTNLDAFSVINPCGFTDRGVTSIAQETGMTVDIIETAKILDFEFRQLLEPRRRQ
ncbi:MAG: lipoyl(octanoyl) transferase LipB [Muribaculaceae bacterium]|nr:lipoyl(octanoyl) transferase LipB [Muribaculaceae bacterium]